MMSMQLAVGVRVDLLQVLQRHGVADAGDDVLALGVLEVVAVDALLAGGGVAGEGDAGAGVHAEVAEDHRDHVDRRAEVVEDALLAAVEDRARSAFQESKTALMARSICSVGSCGKSWPVSRRTISL